MGPLFALGLLAALGALVFLGGYLAARTFGHGILTALIVSMALCIGGVAGAVVAGLVAAGVLGAGGTLESKLSVALYLLWLCSGALIGGLLCARIVSMRSNKSLERGRGG
jgi:hypothetical protein